MSPVPMVPTACTKNDRWMTRGEVQQANERFLQTELHPMLEGLKDAIDHPGGNPPVGYLADNWSDVIGDWFHEEGPQTRVYDASHQITRDLMKDRGVQEAREAWVKAGKPKKNFRYSYKFGINDYARELFSGDGTGSTLGSYDVYIDERPDGKLNFTVKNTTGWKSGTRFPIIGDNDDPSIEDIITFQRFPSSGLRSILNDRDRKDFGPGGNFTQHYRWTE